MKVLARSAHNKLVCERVSPRFCAHCAKFGAELVYARVPRQASALPYTPSELEENGVAFCTLQCARLYSHATNGPIPVVG